MPDEITETEALLQQERARLSDLITYSHDGVVLVDSGMRLLVINIAALRYLDLSGGPESWVDRSLPDIVRHVHTYAPQAASDILAELHRVRSGDECPGEGRYHGETHVIHWWNLPVQAEKAVLGRLLIFRDEPASRGVKDRDGPTHLSAGDIDALLAAVTDFVEVCALLSGRMPLCPCAFSFPDLLDGVLELERPLAQERRLSMEGRINEGLPLTWGDRSLIRRVLQHLVMTALQATAPGGKVRIEAGRAARDSEKIEVSVTDTGHPGPRRAGAEQAIANGDRESHAADLGLAFCCLVLRAHGERIWVSRTSSIGTTVAFTLPQLSDSLTHLHAIH